ncbi:Holliday junction branch migration protein RuvA [Corynebacterium guangdongense]|uniref:Holliday junction branch migration complex subunit RuvA n=1 Tax=Corynebacterium guangdongense TaxID=1783348 RepID=A0ABU1ZZZ0_9CORY|nr:Holliday junction branch migration protein RuvA [Corynebacterium guangdongense]MDR7329463.1 Holliday junction DNA helicase RuvA [Corynebacterium guangdongense]WJZ18028.1 Holliday junction ATP-dependent DNA helicase RuvA [Corynebacterium guangdongense]
MIASLRGEVLSIGLDHVVLECGGVGYQVLATPPTLGRLRRGEETRILTTMVVREDAMLLYGFLTDDERQVFTLLQTVSGLGPKLAMAILGTLKTPELAQAVSQKDTKTLQRVPGVGKRMAERMVVELSGKFDLYLPSAEEQELVPALPAQASGVAEDVTEALVGLGFTDRIAKPVVDGILAAEGDLDVATALRAALSELGRVK